MALAVGVVVFAAFGVLARFSPALVRRLLGREQAVQLAAKLAGRVVAGALVLLGLFIALGLVFHSNEVALTGVILATVVASIGVQDLLKNYVSGFYVLLERNVRLGDVVTVGTFRGTVTDIRLRVTSLRAEDGSLIVVPNTELFNSVVQVQSTGGGAPRHVD